jgi:RHS repeat-associated protein
LTFRRRAAGPASHRTQSGASTQLVGLLVGIGSAQTLYYLQSDALGSAGVAIDPVRDVAVWRWDLTGDVFGASAPNEDPDGDGTRFTLNLRFPGQQYDAATGLHYNYYRDYDPTVGRYVQSDPIGLLGGMSTYGYANLSPGSFRDPLGLKGKGLGGRLGAALSASMAAKAWAEACRAWALIRFCSPLRSHSTASAVLQ